jgi:GNAT superfamily N-acetyltransferase
MNIREATIDDLPAILTLYAQPAIDDGQCLKLDQAARIFRTMQTYPCYKIFLAEQDKQIVGTFALLIMDNLGHLGKPSGLVEDVAVSPAFHRQGIGRAMMHFAMEKCRERGCYKMALSSNLVRTEAHAFYESLGFIRHGYSFIVEFGD